MEDEGPVDALDVLVGRGVNAEMGKVFFQDGEFRGGRLGGGDSVVFCAAVLDDHLETFRHRNNELGVVFNVRVATYVCNGHDPETLPLSS